MNRALDTKKILGLLGFAARARRLQTGTEIVTTNLRKRAAGPAGHSKKGACGVVLVAADASENTVKRITNSAQYYGVPCYRLPIPKSELSRAIGKLADVAVCGVFDKGFAEAILKLLEEEETASAAITYDRRGG